MPNFAWSDEPKVNQCQIKPKAQILQILNSELPHSVGRNVPRPAVAG
jgi:hypothetical protein